MVPHLRRTSAADAVVWCNRQPWSPLPALLAVLVATCELCAVTAGAEPRPVVEVFGRQLFVDGKPFHLKGVNWNPVRRGGQNPQDLDFRGFVEADAEIMSLAGINVVRTYDAIMDIDVLDALWSRSIFVLNSVYVNAEQPIESLIPKVRTVVGHPAVLMWVVGNEWNFNGFYQKLEFHDSRRLLKRAAQLVRSEDHTRPIATIYGGLPDSDTLAVIGDDIDVWGVNQYEKTSFGPLFRLWADLPTSKPMFLGEYGADAFNSLKGKPDEIAQAEATRSLTEEIIANTTQREGGVCAGGLIFEFADEWWKSGHPGTHDVDGAGGSVFGAVYPDETFNEEWWGLVAYDGTQRAAFRAFAEVSSPDCAVGSRLPGCGRDPPRATSGERLRACGASEACAGMLGRCCPDDQSIRHSCCPAPDSTATAAALVTSTATTKGNMALNAREDAADEDDHPRRGKRRNSTHGGRPALNETSARDGRRRKQRREDGATERRQRPKSPSEHGHKSSSSPGGGGAASRSTEEKWTCNAGFYYQFAGAKSWPADKRRWCCKHRGIACPEEDEGEHEIHLAKKFEVLKFWRWIPALPDHFMAPLSLLLAGIVAIAFLGCAQALVLRRPAAGFASLSSPRRRRRVCYGELAPEGQAADVATYCADHRCLAPRSVSRSLCQDTPRLLEDDPRLLEV